MPKAPPPPPPGFTPGMIDGQGRPTNAPKAQKIDYASFVEAVRSAYPDTFDKVDPADVAEATFRAYPQMRSLVDPVTLGSETLARTSRDLRPREPQPLPTVTNPTAPALLSTHSAITTGLRVVPAMAGGAIGAALAGVAAPPTLGASAAAAPWSTAAGTFAGGYLGEQAAQLYERGVGISDEISQTNVVAQAALNTVPFARMLGLGGKAAGALLEGAIGGTSGTALEVGFEEGRLIGPAEATAAAGLGAGFGGAFHGVGALNQAVNTSRAKRLTGQADRALAVFEGQHLPFEARNLVVQEVVDALQEATRLNPDVAKPGFDRLLTMLDGQRGQDEQLRATAYLQSLAQRADRMTATERLSETQEFLKGLQTDVMTAESFEQVVRTAAGIHTLAESAQIATAPKMLPPAPPEYFERAQSLGAGTVEPIGPARYVGPDGNPIELPAAMPEGGEVVGTPPLGTRLPPAPPPEVREMTRDGRSVPEGTPDKLGGLRRVEPISPVPPVVDWREAKSASELQALREADRLEGLRRFYAATPGELPGVGPPPDPWRKGPPAAAVPPVVPKGVDLLPGVKKGHVKRMEAAVLQWLRNDMVERTYSPARPPDGAGKDGLWATAADERAFEQDTGRNPNLWMPREAGTRTLKAIEAILGEKTDRTQLKRSITSMLEGRAQKGGTGKLQQALMKYARLLDAAHDPATGKLDWDRVTDAQWGKLGRHRTLIIKSTPETPAGMAFKIGEEAEDVLQRFAAADLALERRYKEELEFGPQDLEVEVPSQVKTYLGGLDADQLETLYQGLLEQGPDGAGNRQYVQQALEARGLRTPKQARLGEPGFIGPARLPDEAMLHLEDAAFADRQAREAAQAEQQAQQQAEAPTTVGGDVPRETPDVEAQVVAEGAATGEPKLLAGFRALQAEPGMKESSLAVKLGVDPNRAHRIYTAAKEWIARLSDETGAVGRIAQSKAARAARVASLGERAPAALRIEQTTYDSLTRGLEKHGAADGEVAGLVLGTPDGQIRKVIISRNTAENPDTTFTISPDSIAKAQVQARQAGLEVLGSFHTQPSGTAEPSSRDLQGGVADLPMVIFGTRGGQVRDVGVWQPRGKKAFDEGTLDIGPAAGKDGQFPAKTRPIAKAISKIPRFTGAVGDTPAITSYLRTHARELSTEPFYQKALLALHEGNPAQAWMELQTAQILYSGVARDATSRLTAGKTGKALDTARGQAADLRSRVAQLESRSVQDPVGQLFALYDGRTTWVKGVGRIVVSPTLPPSLAGKGITASAGGVLQPPTPHEALPDEATRRRLTVEAINEVLVDARGDEILDMPDGQKLSEHRVFSQIAEQMMLQPGRFHAIQALGVSPEQVAGHFKADISEAAKMLASLSKWKAEHALAIRTIEGIQGADGGIDDLLIHTKSGQTHKLSTLAEGSDYFAEVIRPTNAWDKVLILQTIGRGNIGKFDQFGRASSGFMLSGLSTAMRNFHSATGRWGTEAFDAIFEGLAHAASGNTKEAALSLKRAGDVLTQAPILRPSGWIMPWAARQADFEQVFDFNGRFLQMATPERRAIIAALRSSPDHAARFLGSMAFSDPASAANAKSGVRLLDSLASPKVQQTLTMFNRAQEFTVRAAIFHVSLKDQLRKAGFNPDTLLALSPDELRARVGEEKWQQILDTSVGESLDFTFAGDTIHNGLGLDAKGQQKVPFNTQLIDVINDTPFIREGYKFARFNLSAAPRYIWDHSGTGGIIDVILAKTMNRGRYALGRNAKRLRDHLIPQIDQEITAAKRDMTTALGAWHAIREDLAARRRVQANFDKMPARAEGPRQDAQQTLPDLQSKIDANKAEIAKLEGVVIAQKTAFDTASALLKSLEAQRAKHQVTIKAAAGANAPESIQQLIGRNVTGAFVMLPIAMMIRAQQREEGTKWYDIKYGGEVWDTRALAPFTQYLFVADVIQDMYSSTDWEGVMQDLDQGLYTWNRLHEAWTVHGRYSGQHTGDQIATGFYDLLAGLGFVPELALKTGRAMYGRHEGKYTSANLTKEGVNAFLSISQAAGTTLAVTELLTDVAEGQGIPDADRFLSTILNAVGQMLARYTTPARQFMAVSDLYDDDESKARIADQGEGFADPDTVIPGGTGLAAFAGNLPFIGAKFIPETYNQLSGQPLDTHMPLLRSAAGITLRKWEQVTGEVAATGLAGPSVYIKKTKVPYLDRLIGLEYSSLVQQYMPAYLESPEYKAFDSPALRRDQLAQYFKNLKEAAINTVQVNLGDHMPVVGASVEARRKQLRRERFAALRLEEGLEDRAEVEDLPVSADPEPEPEPEQPPFQARLQPQF